MIALTDGQLVVLSIGCLILSAFALRAQQLNARRAVVYALIWGAIFFAVAAIFRAVG